MKKGTLERLSMAMDFYDANNVSWQDCLKRHELGKTYMYIPKIHRTKTSVKVARALANLRTRSIDAFNFIVEELSQKNTNKHEFDDSLFSLDNVTDMGLVKELRNRGYNVTATKEIRQTIEL